MKNLFRVAAVIAVGALLASGAFAQSKAAPKAPMHKKMMAKPVPCPVCKMPLSMKKTKADPVAVRLKKGGRVMYCCAGCKMPASVLVKPTPKKKA